MIVAGVDIAVSKPVYIAICDNQEKIRVILPADPSPEAVARLIPPTVDAVVWEEPYSKDNAHTYKQLIQFSTELRLLLKFRRFETATVPPAHWQAPLKQALGLKSKPAAMSADQWSAYKLSKYELLIKPQLAAGVSLSRNKGARGDQVAAACMALHHARREKSREALGVWK